MNTRGYTLFIAFLALAFLLGGCKQQEVKDKEAPSVVKLEKVGQAYELMKDGTPFFIKGAGLEFGNMESLRSQGGNSFRTWRVNNGVHNGKEVLDEAQKNGLMVCMGLELARERHGFDYNDSIAVQQQFEQIKSQVLELKDHPALLMWGIGNELNLRATNDKVWDAVNEISKMIHQKDGNHPTTTMLAGADSAVINQVLSRANDLDLISFQLYGDIVNLPEHLKKAAYDGAYIVSEWGATGHWEMPQTEWGRPVENTSHQKAADYKIRYESVIAADSDHCIGSFVFLWGQKQERTPTWYGIYLEDGSETEAVDVMHYVWNNQWPQNKAPELEEFLLDGKNAFQNVICHEGQNCRASTVVTDPDGDALTYRFELLKEVPREDESDGGDVEKRPETIWESTTDSISSVEILMPSAGEYRLFVYAYDGKGKAATANIPVLITEK